MFTADLISSYELPLPLTIIRVVQSDAFNTIVLCFASQNCWNLLHILHTRMQSRSLFQTQALANFELPVAESLPFSEQITIFTTKLRLESMH